MSSTFFRKKLAKFVILGNRNKNSFLCTFSWYLQASLNISWNKGYASWFLSMNSPTKFYHFQSNYIVDTVVWRKLWSSRFSTREVPITSFCKDLTRKNSFFEGWSWFKFLNLELVLGMALTFYSSVAKVLKRKVRKFWELIPTFRGVTMKRNKLIFWGGYFLFAPHAPLLVPHIGFHIFPMHFSCHQLSFTIFLV